LSAQGVELLDPKQLVRFSLPKTVTSPQGLDFLLMEKAISLNYDVFDIFKVPHSYQELPTTTLANAPVGPAGEIGTAGEGKFKARSDRIILVFSWYFSIATTATVGTRSFEVWRYLKSGNAIDHVITNTQGASTTGVYAIGPLQTGSETIRRGLTYPWRLDPEMYLDVDDINNIDNADTIQWRIEYLELAV